jgi:hypothetical protein
MSTTKAQEPKAEETVFPDQLSFRVFLEEVERAALYNRVPKEKIPIILEFLKKHFLEGKNLPELNWPREF